MSLKLAESELALAGTKGKVAIFADCIQLGCFFFPAKHQCVLRISGLISLSCLAKEIIDVSDSISVRVRLHMLQSEFHTGHLHLYIFRLQDRTSLCSTMLYCALGVLPAFRLPWAGGYTNIRQI